MTLPLLALLFWLANGAASYLVLAHKVKSENVEAPPSEIKYLHLVMGPLGWIVVWLVGLK